MKDGTISVHTSNGLLALLPCGSAVTRSSRSLYRCFAAKQSFAGAVHELLKWDQAISGAGDMVWIYAASVGPQDRRCGPNGLADAAAVAICSDSCGWKGGHARNRVAVERKSVGFFEPQGCRGMRDRGHEQRHNETAGQRIVWNLAREDALVTAYGRLFISDQITSIVLISHIQLISCYAVFSSSKSVGSNFIVNYPKTTPSPKMYLSHIHRTSGIYSKSHSSSRPRSSAHIVTQSSRPPHYSAAYSH